MRRTHLATTAAARAVQRVFERASLILLCTTLFWCAGCNRSQTGTGPKTVAIVTPARSNWFNSQLIEGAQNQADLLGWKAVQFYSPPGDADDAVLAALAMEALKKKPDAISVCGMDVNKLSEVVHAANLAGIPIFIHNQLEPAGGKVEAYIGYDEYDAGKKCGEEALEYLRKHGKNDVPEGKVAVVEGTPGSHNDRRVAGFRDVLKYSEHVSIVEEKSADWSNETAEKLASQWLERHPDLFLVFACNDAMARGVSRAASSAHKEIKIIGYGGSPDGLFGVKAGYVSSTLATNPRKMGSRIVHVMMDVFGNSGVIKPGEPVITDITIVNSSTVDAFMGGFAPLHQEQPQQPAGSAPASAGGTAGK